MAKCRVFAIDDGLKAVVPDGLYGKHYFGSAISVSVVKFVLPKGPDLPAKSHHHGEEISLQIRGGCSVFQGAGADGGDDPEYLMDQGDVLVIPAGTSHYGGNSYDAGGASLRLNIVTPPRKEFGPEDSAPYYPLKDRA
jgi:quercetin dioxygenase-like cupin family protein